MNRFLVRVATGEVFPWTEVLSKRSGFKEVEADSAADALAKSKEPEAEADDEREDKNTRKKK
jgi:hypothetical protein